MSPTFLPAALAAACVAASVLLARWAPGVPGAGRGDGARGGGEAGRSWPVTVALALAAGGGAWALLGGVTGVVVGAVLGVGAAILWRNGGASRAAHDRLLASDLPHLVSLLASALRAGRDPVSAVEEVCRALPGPAADRLASVLATARVLGPPRAWAELAGDPVLGRLGQTLLRAHRAGSPVARAVDRLADELAADQRAAAEDRARRVGVQAAVPLGVCLLPAFLLVGIVPTVAGMLGAVLP